MLVTIEEFRSRVEADCPGLIADLQALTGRYGCAPCKGGAFQWVKGPLGERSSRKQPEQLGR